MKAKRFIAAAGVLIAGAALSLAATVGAGASTIQHVRPAVAQIANPCDGCSVNDSGNSSLGWAYNTAATREYFDSSNSHTSASATFNKDVDHICGSGGEVTSTCPFTLGSGLNTTWQGSNIVYFLSPAIFDCMYSETNGHFEAVSSCDNTVSNAFVSTDSGHEYISVGGTNFAYGQSGMATTMYVCGQGSNQKIVWTPHPCEFTGTWNLVQH